jgi:predicted  nucleic acid-binding Zn-ribbon protein
MSMDVRPYLSSRPQRARAAPHRCSRCGERADLALVQRLLTGAPVPARRARGPLPFDAEGESWDEGFDALSEDLDAFADEAAPGDPVANAQAAVRRAQEAYNRAREAYQARVREQQIAVRSRGAYGEEEVQRRMARTEAASRALLRAERELRRAESALRRLLGGGRGPYR